MNVERHRRERMSKHALDRLHVRTGRYREMLRR
jgi:hypothetical protein